MYVIEADPRPTKWVVYPRWFGCDFIEPIKYFLAKGIDDYDFIRSGSDCADIDCWEVEFFPTHAAKLFIQGCTDGAITHLYDFIRESLFLRKIFTGFLLEKSAKNYATANAFGCPDSSSSPRLDPTRGRNIGSK